MTRQTYEDVLTALQANLLNRIGVWMVLVGGLSAFGLKGLGMRLDDADPSTVVMIYGVLVWALGVFALTSTGFGWGTFRALRRARMTIDRFQRLPAAWQAKQSGLYCVRVGVKTAAYQRGVETQLVSKIRNTWSGPVS